MRARQDSRRGCLSIHLSILHSVSPSACSGVAQAAAARVRARELTRQRQQRPVSCLFLFHSVSPLLSLFRGGCTACALGCTEGPRAD